MHQKRRHRLTERNPQKVQAAKEKVRLEQDAGFHADISLEESVRTCRQNTQKHCTHSAVQSVHKRGTHRTRLLHLCAPEKNLSSGLHMSHPLLLSHMPFTTSTSSSSFTLPSTTTQEHAAQSGQHDLLQEHPVHHEHLRALLVDKQRHQESLWRQDLQSGGNPRTTTPTGYEPKELATVSRISREIDPCQFLDAQKEFGERDHRAPIIEEVKEFGEIGSHILADSKILETSYFQSHMHFDDSAECTADSDLEDGELQMMMTSPLYAQKAPGTPDAMVVRERGKCTKHSSRLKGQFEVTHLTVRKLWRNPMHCFHLSMET